MFRFWVWTPYRSDSISSFYTGDDFKYDKYTITVDPLYVVAPAKFNFPN